MTAGEINEISHLLGAIEARLGTIEKNQDNESETARRHRSDLRVTIAAQATATMALNSKVEKLTDDVSDMKPLTEDYRTRRDQGSGMVMALRAAWIALGGALAAIVGYWARRLGL